MIKVSKIYTTAPTEKRTPLEDKVYEVLEELQIPYERVDTDEAISMEDCYEINKVLDMDMVKTIFLCNRKKTSFFLYITTAEKKFDTKLFSKKLGLSHLSFAPAELMEKYLGVKIGAATVFGTLLDEEDYIQVIVDQEVADMEWYGCSAGTTTSYMKLPTKQILHTFLPYVHHPAKIISI